MSTLVRSGGRWVESSSSARKPALPSLRTLGTGVLAVIAAGSVFAPSTTLWYGGITAGLIFVLHALGRGRVYLPDVLALVIAGTAFASSTWALRPDYAREYALVVGANVAIFLAVRAVCDTRRRLLTVAAAFVAGSLWSVVQVVRSNDLSIALSRAQPERYGIEGINYNYSAYACTGALVCVLLLWKTAGPLARLALAVSVPVLAYGVTLAGTRTAFIGVVLLGIWVIVYRIAPRPMLIGAAIGATALGYSVVSGDLDRLLVSNFDAGSRATGDLSNRIPIWTAARDLWGEHRWMGTGAGGFQRDSVFQVGPHDVALEFLTSYGWLGLVLLSWFAFTALMSRMELVDLRLRSLIVGGFIMAQAPAWLGGQWVSGCAAWVVLGIVSALPAWVSESADTDVTVERSA